MFVRHITFQDATQAKGSTMTTVQPRALSATIEVRNPADGAVVGEVPIDTPEAVAAKVAELRLFQPEWEAIGPKGRKAWLLKFQDWMSTTPNTSSMCCSPRPVSRASTPASSRRPAPTC